MTPQRTFCFFCTQITLSWCFPAFICSFEQANIHKGTHVDVSKARFQSPFHTVRFFVELMKVFLCAYIFLMLFLEVLLGLTNTFMSCNTHEIYQIYTLVLSYFTVHYQRSWLPYELVEDFFNFPVELERQIWNTDDDVFNIQAKMRVVTRQKQENMFSGRDSNKWRVILKGWVDS